MYNNLTKAVKEITFLFFSDHFSDNLILKEQAAEIVRKSASLLLLGNIVTSI